MTLLRSGDRVETPDGPAVVLSIESREERILGMKPQRRTLVLVKLVRDAKVRRYFRPQVIRREGGRST